MPNYDNNDDSLLNESVDRIVNDVRENLDENRLSAIRVDRDGIFQVVDDILTRADTAKLPMEDVRMIIEEVRKPHRKQSR
jgi:hypothetical protein